MTTVEKIVAILERHGVEWPGGAKNARIRRTRAGYWQRAAGAWSWFLQAIDRDIKRQFPCVGSQWPAKQVAKGATVTRSVWGDYNLDPEGET